MDIPPSRIHAFDNAQELINQARQAKKSGCDLIEVYAPYRVDEMDAMIPPRPALLRIVLWAALVGLSASLCLSIASGLLIYPAIIGRFSSWAWPRLVLRMIAWSCLFAAVATYLGSFWGCRWPRSLRPIFQQPDFNPQRFYLEVEEPFDPDA